MAKKKKLHAKGGLSREELRRDRFLEISAELLIYIRRRKERFIFGLVAVIALISIGNYYLTGKENSHSEAEFELTMAHQYLFGGVHEEALLRYQTVVEEYGDSKQAREAQYWLGQTNFVLGKYDEAIEAYEKFLSVSSNDDILSPSALRGLAACYETMGDYVKAVSTYLKIHEEYPENPISAVACLNAGVCYEKIEEYNRAEKMYRIVIEKYARSDFAKDAKINLSFLRGKLQAKGLPPTE